MPLMNSDECDRNRIYLIRFTAYRSVSFTLEAQCADNFGFGFGTATTPRQLQFTHLRTFALLKVPRSPEPSTYAMPRVQHSHIHAPSQVHPALA